MPRAYEMSWIHTRKRWEKMYKGQTFVVSCRQLGCPTNKEESATAANEWWRKKQLEVDLASQRIPQALDDLIGAVYEPRILTHWQALMTHAGKFPAVLQDALAKFLALPLSERSTPDSPAWSQMIDALRTITAADIFLPMLLDGKPLPLAVEQSLPQPRVQEIEHGIKGVRGEQTTVMEKTVKAHAARWQLLQADRVAAGRLKPLRYRNVWIYVRHFMRYVGENTDASTLSGATLSAYYQHCLKQIALRNADNEGKAGWSHDYTKENFQTAKRFINWLWDEGVIEQQPRGLRQRFDFGSGVQKVPVWTVEEVHEALSKSSEMMQLVILLYLNCGMTQIDIAELRDGEVDWQNGRIIRKRNKTRDRKNTPEVNYKLWPRTFALLKANRSYTDIVLLNSEGKKLVRSEVVNGKPKSYDGVGTIYRNRLRPKLSFRKNLKSLRKTAPTLLRTQPEYRPLARLLLGRAPQGVDERHYYGDESLDAALDWLGRTLRLND